MPSERKRPIGVTIVGTLYIIIALLWFIPCAIFTAEAGLVIFRIIGIGSLFAVGFSIIAGFYLFKMRKWAWVVTMVACIIYLLSEIIYSIKIGHFSPRRVMMIITGIIILYLSIVKRAFLSS